VKDCRGSYTGTTDATELLGDVDEIRNLFFGFQKHLYAGQEVQA